MDEIVKIALSAIFHNIEKFRQRAGGDELDKIELFNFNVDKDTIQSADKIASDLNDIPSNENSIKDTEVEIGLETPFS